MSNTNGFTIENGMLTKYTGAGGDVVIPDGVTEIGPYAFWNCTNLTSITIPAGVTEIGENAFSWCVNLTSLTIPDGVTKIGWGAFSSCPKLQTIEVDPANPVYQIVGGCLINKKDGVLIWGNETSVIPDDGSIKIIAASAFCGCEGLTSVTIPDSVTEIGSGAFQYCKNLTSVTIPAGVTEIGKEAFSCCYNLTSVTIPAGVTEIGEEAFSCCYNFTSITIPDSVTEIGSGAFQYCKNLTSVTIPDSVTEIGESAFSHCENLTSITIPDGVTEIGESAFRDCKALTSVTIPDSVTKIGELAFSGCENVTVELTDLNGLFSLPLDPEYLQNGFVKEILIQGEPVRTKLVIGKAKIRKFFIAYMEKNPDVKMYLDDDACKAGEPLPPEAMEWIEPTDEQLAYLLVYQSGKKWDVYLRSAITKNNANEVMKHCGEILRTLKKIKPKQAQVVAETALIYGKSLEGDTVRGLSEALTALKQPNAELNKLAAQAGNASVPADPTEEKLEQFADACDQSSEEYKTALPLIGAGFAMKGSGKTSPRVAVALVAQFIRIWKKICTVTPGNMSDVEILNARTVVSYHTDPILHSCDEIVCELDHDALIAFLKRMIEGNRYRPFLIPFCAYATEQEIPWLITEIRSSKKGNAQSKYKAGNAEAALLFSETKAACMYLDGIGFFSYYAAFRGIDEEEARIRYLYNFDLDENGEKVYDLGSKSVTLRLNRDLSLVVIDGGKEVKSIPKKDSDPEKYEAAKKHFADMKSTLKKVSKSVISRLREQFYESASYEKNSWQEQYCLNPVLRSVARLIVWKQGKKTFMLTDTGTVDVTGAPYTLTDEEILLAHPMEMAKEEVAAWQNTLLSHSLKQPFDQMWEPVVNFDSIKDDRYTGCELPLFRFNNQYGIELNKDTEYNHRTNSYEYEGIYIYIRDCSFEWEPASGTIREMTMQSPVRINQFVCKSKSRITNHIIAYLDKCTVFGRILKDDVAVKDQLDNFTAAQIMEFIRVASENQCVKVSALLLEYKNQHYAAVDPLAGLTLDI